MTAAANTTPATSASPTPTTTSATTDDKKAVNLSLHPGAFAHFKAKAEEDGRTVNAFLARLLHKLHKDETTPATTKVSASVQSDE